MTPTGNLPAVGPDDLVRAILGEEPHLTAVDIIMASGLSEDDVRALWRALGFSDPGDAAAFTTADRDALAQLRTTIHESPIDFETALRLTRAVARTMARLADWQVATLGQYVDQLEATGRGTGSRIVTAAQLLETVGRPFEQMMLYVWRRHLAAAVTRVEALGAGTSGLSTADLTVGFADLVSFTRLSAAVDQQRLGVLVEDFEARCADLIAAAGGRVIKTLGDSVLFVTDAPKTAIEIAADLIDQIGEQQALPDLHVGLATGLVAMRLGDVFGDPVNLASRLTSVARRNRIICDEATAGLISGDPEFVTRPLTQRLLRGVGLVTPVAVRRRSRPTS